MSNATTNAILDNARAALPGIADDVVLLALFTVCDDLAREALRVASPANPDAAPDTWLPVDQWVPNYQTLLSGTLAALYGQPNKPYYNADFAKFYGDRYGSYRVSSRATSAGAATAVATIPDRIVSSIRAQIPLIRDEAINLVMFSVANDIRDEAYRLPALVSSANPPNWFTPAQYEQSFLALSHGTAARIYGQVGTPWFNLDLYKAEEEFYQRELFALRAIASIDPQQNLITPDRIVSQIRAQIPNIQDEAILAEMWGVTSTLRVDAFNLLAHGPNVDIPANWLSPAQYQMAHLAILYGTLTRLYGQSNMPWFSLEQQAAQKLLYDKEFNSIRAAMGVDPHRNLVTPDRIVSQIRVLIPSIRDEAILAEMWGVTSAIRVDVFRLLDHPANVDIPTNWLSEEQYQVAHRTILNGTLARLYGQSNMPWFNPDEQERQQGLYLQELAAIRATAAIDPHQNLTTPDRLVSQIRTQIPAVRPEAILQELWGVASALRVDVFRLSDTAANVDTPTSWLSLEQYQKAHLALLYGTLSRLYGQVSTPWFNLDQQKAQYDLFQLELVAIRVAEAGSTAATDTIVERLVSAVRAEIPYARDEAINLAMFACVERLRIEAYRLSPLTGANVAPTSWFSTEQYEQAYLAIQHGTLYRLYAQAGQPWFNNELSQAQLQLYQVELISLRMVLAGAVEATDSIPERLVSAVRAQIQLVRDEAVKLEMFNVVNKLRIEAYGLAMLKGVDTDYTTWLTATQYEESYLVILHGTLAGLYGQSNMPWYNLDLYKAQLVLYQLELDLVRNENIEVVGGLDSLIDEVKPHLPGARDEVLWIELRRCVDEFLKTTQVWEEDIKVKIRPTSTVYEIEPDSNASIVRLLWVNNSSLLPVRASMLNIPWLVLERAPDVKDTFIVTVSLTLQGSGCCSSCGSSCTSCSCGNSLGFPNWIFDRWHEAFFDGLIGRMMLQPGKPYSGTITTTGGRIASDPTSYHLKRFRSAMAEARSAARSQNIYAGQRWRFPAFA